MNLKRRLSEGEISALKVLALLVPVMNTKIPEASLKYRKKKESVNISAKFKGKKEVIYSCFKSV